MVISDIFCRNDHLILDAPRCSLCDWVRPLSARQGEVLWDVELGAMLGGSGRRVFAIPAASGGVVVYPHAGGALSGLDLASGGVLWRSSLPEGMITSQIVAHQGGFLCAATDSRPIMEVGKGMIAALDPAGGGVSPAWESRSHQLSPIYAGDNYLVLRTYSAELLVFECDSFPAIRLAKTLRGARGFPGLIWGDTVITSDGLSMTDDRGELLAFNLANGQPRWPDQITKTLVTETPAVLNDLFAFRQGSRSVAAHSLESGRQVWEFDFPRVYAPPAAGGAGIFVVVRGKKKVGDRSDYRLISLDPRSGERNWNVRLPARVRIRPVIDGESLYLGTDDGRILAYDSRDGSARWEIQVGEPDDPIQTELVLHAHLLLAGTSGGRASAIQIAEPFEGMSDPEALLADGQYAQAAAVFALGGELLRAAAIYREHLDEPARTYALLEAAGDFRGAGEYAAGRGDDGAAQSYFEKAGDLLAEAEAHLRMGDRLSAARALEGAGEPARAAKLFEELEYFSDATRLYMKLGRWKHIGKLLNLFLLPPDQIDKLVQAGKLELALQAALKNEDLRRAVDIYQQQGDAENELEILGRMAAEIPAGAHPDEWVLQRIVEIAPELDRQDLLGLAWEHLDRPGLAAEAYLKAAAASEAGSAKERALAAHFFEKARDQMEKAGRLNTAEGQNVLAKIRFLRRLPHIKVTAVLEEAFIENESRRIVFLVQNVGFGRACSIEFKLNAASFDRPEAAADDLRQVQWLSPMAPAVEKYATLQPKAGSRGDRTIHLFYSWQDDSQNMNKDKVRLVVRIQRDRTSTPTTYIQHYQAGQQTILQPGSEQKNIHGDLLETGAHKGDIGMQKNVGTGAETVPMKICPDCRRSNPVDAPACRFCGTPFPLQTEGGEE